MNRIGNLGRLATIVACWSLAACATTSPASGPAADEKQLRDSDLDVIFATEFPVSDKADALSRGSAAIHEGDPDRALFFYVKALQFDPQDADLLAVIGAIHQLQGRSEYAVRAYTMALRADPDHVASLVGRGLLLLGHHEDERAIADLSRAVEVSPLAWRALNGLGILADRRGDHTAAIQYYEAAMLVSQSDLSVLMNNRGYSRLLAGDYAAAQADLETAASKLGYKQAWINLGTVYAKQGQYDRSVKAYGQIFSEAEACNRTAEVAIEDGDHAAAERLLERAIARSPMYYPEAEDNLVQLRLHTQ